MKQNEAILTTGLRDELKAIMKKEIQDLPKTLKEVEANKRLDIVCKLMPYVFPKVNAVHSTDDEGWRL